MPTWPTITDGVTVLAKSVFDSIKSYVDDSLSPLATTEVRVLEPPASGTNYNALKSPAMTADVTYTLPAADGTSGYVLTTNGSGTLSWGAAGTTPIGLAGGRLTLTSGTPVTSSNVTGAGTLYYTPYVSGQIALYDGSSAWTVYTFTERSLSLTLTSGKNYDVFAYNNSGTVTLELSAAWTNDTTRADALTTQNGVYVKSGATTRRWLGTIRASGTNTTEDSAAKRFVWNMYNRVSRSMVVIETANTWTYSTDTYRQVNGNSANQLDLVTGLASDAIAIHVRHYSGNSLGSTNSYSSIGLDGTTEVSNIIGKYCGVRAAAGDIQTIHASVSTIPALGRHYYVFMERAVATGTTTWYGDTANPTILQAGIMGSWMS